MYRRLLALIPLFIFIPVFLFGAPASKKKVWVLDAGHGGNDHGCETRGAMEKDITLKVTKRVRDLINANLSGVKVILTRETDKYISLDQRCTIANNAKADLFLSIHVNAAPESNSLRGTETFYGPQGGTKDKELERLRKKNIQKSELLAWMMQKQYGIAGRSISRGVKRERYYVVCYTQMPAILTEIGFITTPSEEQYMKSPQGIEEVAQCIYRGLKEYDETVEKDKIQSTLAQLRRTGGQAMVAQSVQPETKGPVKLTLEDYLVEMPSTAKDVAASTVEQHTSYSKSSQDVQDVQNVSVSTGTISTETVSADSSVAQALTDSTELAGTEEPEEVDEPLMFSVQIFSLRAKLPPTDPRFKGQKDLLVVERDGLYKYLCGTTPDYPGARKLLAEVRESFPDAFLVAYKGSRQISMADAIELLPR